MAKPWSYRYQYAAMVIQVPAYIPMQFPNLKHFNENNQLIIDSATVERRQMRERESFLGQGFGGLPSFYFLMKFLYPPSDRQILPDKLKKINIPIPTLSNILVPYLYHHIHEPQQSIDDPSASAVTGNR